MANMLTSKVFVGRLVQVKIYQSDNSTVVLDLENLKPESITLSDELKESVTEIENGEEVVTAFGFKSTFELNVSHFHSRSVASGGLGGGTIGVDSFEAIDLAETGGKIQVITSTGGENATGQTFSLAGCDQIRAFADNFKMKITAKKSSSSTTRPWTIAENSA
ncbi:MAG: hypothetical protein CMB80_12455 [Flammeovirgaceae bacterium]|nr:hypothetical protein [Flammeovirgaceae bacterium]